MTWLRRGASRALIVVAVAGLAACGDAETNDTRGYTKAPLEEPGMRISPEATGPMDGLGEPIRPAVVDPDQLGQGGA